MEANPILAIFSGIAISKWNHLSQRCNASTSGMTANIFKAMGRLESIHFSEK